ncbi:MAG: NAD(P)/FAD-dependent oxidoreductase [Lewinellaceae bacterium]|nr:NAD(P)/FAD-dependent oxidoreductase [Lewinellaceae bacterium]
MKRIIVIGGGAAGFFGAIRAAECDPTAEVIILERGREVLQKVRVSGGGRCNVTHACFVPRDLAKNYPRGERELLGPFNRFACGDTLDWFAKRGVETKAEADGRIFPITDSSETIIECLLRAAQQAGVSVKLHQRVDRLEPPKEPGAPWRIGTPDRTWQADRVLLTSGSNPAIWKALGAMGHTIIPPVPSLFTFNCKDIRLRELLGVSVDFAEVTVKEIPPLQAAGPLLITHWGFSGPGILRLSAWGARLLAERQYRFTLVVNWLASTPAEAYEELMFLKNSQGKRQVAAHAFGNLPQRLWRKLVTAAAIPAERRWADMTKHEGLALAQELTQGHYAINGKSTFKEEFVTAGGIDLKEVNFKRFESKLFPGLYFAGEVLDIDAITGGFNFQAAWTGGYIAGEAMAE